MIPATGTAVAPILACRVRPCTGRGDLNLHGIGREWPAVDAGGVAVRLSGYGIV